MANDCKMLYSASAVSVYHFRSYDVDSHHGHEQASDKDELVFLNKGAIIKADTQGTHWADQTRLVLFRTGEPYTIRYPDSEGDVATILTFRPDLIRDAFPSRTISKDSGLAEISTTLPVNPGILIQIQALRCAVSQSPAPELYIEEVATRLLDSLSRLSDIPLPDDTIPRGNWCRIADRARSYICYNYTHSVTVREIARELMISPYHLCRIYRSVTGKTIHDHIKSLRMASALQRLDDYKGHLSYLAADLGFSSHSHFSKEFKSFFGVRPTDLQNLGTKSHVRKILTARTDNQ